MPDEVPVDVPASSPEPVEVTQMPVEASLPEIKAPEAVPEPQTAQIPANEPIVTSPQPSPSVVTPVINFARDLAAKARTVIQGRKRKKLDKILEAVTKHGSITNDQVEKLLHVSDATATRYLTQLEKEGKLKQEGKTGKSVKYLKL